MITEWGVRGRVGARLLGDGVGGCWVQPSGVDPAFAAALEAQIRSRRAS